MRTVVMGIMLSMPPGGSKGMHDALCLVATVRAGSKAEVFCFEVVRTRGMRLCGNVAVVCSRVCW